MQLQVSFDVVIVVVVVVLVVFFLSLRYHVSGIIMLLFDFVLFDLL